MPDIVTSLRAIASMAETAQRDQASIAARAADEIERLRAALEKIARSNTACGDIAANALNQQTTNDE